MFNFGIFPDPAGVNTLYAPVAVGGELSVPYLLEAYSKGIFPWYNEDPIEWHSPELRMILIPEKLKVSKSLKKSIRKHEPVITADTAFSEVIEACSEQRAGFTWINREMVEAYNELHRSGYAHSIEVWINGKLAGGLYGVSLGRMFAGESMFFRVTDASKMAFLALADWALKHEIHFIDAQVPSEHMKKFGAEVISKEVFLPLLDKALQAEAPVSAWQSHSFTTGV